MRHAYQLVASVTFGWALVDTASGGIGQCESVAMGYCNRVQDLGAIANRWAVGHGRQCHRWACSWPNLFKSVGFRVGKRIGVVVCSVILLSIAMCKYVLIAALAVMCSSVRVQATLHDLPGVFDFSNVDLVNFQYFKNLASQDPRTAASANPLLVHFQKKKAVLDYLDRLFFGNSPFQQPSEIPFDPHFGRSWRPVYERKFGYRGERLIAALGSGYSVPQLRHFGAIPREYGTPHYPS